MVKPGAIIDFAVKILGADPGGLEVIQDVARVGPTGASSMTTPRRSSWTRVNVRDAAGRLLLIGKPIYLRVAP